MEKYNFTHLPQILWRNENFQQGRRGEFCEWQWSVGYVCYIIWWK